MKRYFLKYEEFLNEALPVSFAKAVNNVPRDENVEAILKQAFPTKERVYIDLDKDQVKKFNETAYMNLHFYNSIVDFLESKGVEIIDYVNNIAKEPNQKNFTKITKLLSKYGAENMLKFYVRDFSRIELSKNKSKTYKIVISKAKYDIAGMSTDRYWDSCMKLDVKKPNTLGSGGKGAGNNASYVKHDLTEGTIIAYLISEEDTNIKNPFGRVLIKPFISEDGKVVWYPESKCYGNVLNFNEEFNNHFLQKVKDWIDINLNSITTKDLRDGRTFIKNKKLYNDSIEDDNTTELEYKDGRIGKPLTQTTTFGNGMIKSITNYNRDGVKDGEYKSWYYYSQDDEKIMDTHCFYKNDDLHGEYKQWYENGQLWVHCFYMYDKLEGEYKSWWDNGNPMIHCFYKDGEYNGDYKEYYRLGGLMEECEYKGGIRVGVRKEYYENGNPNSERTYNNIGKCIEGKEWDKNGDKVITHWKTINGKMTWIEE